MIFWLVLKLEISYNRERSGDFKTFFVFFSFLTSGY
jgi:hypothetical protein